MIFTPAVPFVLELVVKLVYSTNTYLNVKHIPQLKSEIIFPQHCLTISSTWSTAPSARLLDDI